MEFSKQKKINSLRKRIEDLKEEKRLKRDKNRISVILKPKTNIILREVAKEYDLKISDIVRLAIDEFIDGGLFER